MRTPARFSCSFVLPVALDDKRHRIEFDPVKQRLRAALEKVVSRIFRTLGLGGLSHQALILCCLSRFMFMYRLADHLVPAMCLDLAAARLRAD